MQWAGTWQSAARTDKGKVRPRNEDAFLNVPQHGLWVVADGMGGHPCGDIASQMIVSSLADLPASGDFDDRLNRMRQCLHWLNRRFNQDLTITAGNQDSIMGSTVVALLMEPNRAVCVWAGDSRCYLWRGQRLYQLSRDHSLLQQLLDEQQMSVEQAKAHPSAHALTRAIGASSTLTLEVLEFEVHEGDSLLLCSDGLYQGLGADVLGSALSLKTPQRALDQLFERALQGPAKDNLTAVVVRV